MVLPVSHQRKDQIRSEFLPVGDAGYRAATETAVWPC